VRGKKEHGIQGFLLTIPGCEI